MVIYEKEIFIPKEKKHTSLLSYVSGKVSKAVSPGEIPVRFVIYHTDKNGYNCELGVLTDIGNAGFSPENSIFDFNKRRYENTEKFNAIMLVPTGIGAEIGGHSGDSGPVAKLLASVCDQLITHPNVANAADINELPENALYVEGSIIARLLMGSVGLQKVRANRILTIVDRHPDSQYIDATINSVSAAHAVAGIECRSVIKLNKNLIMKSLYADSGRAAGRIEEFLYLCKILKKYRAQYDAVALSTIIDVPKKFHKDYFMDNFNMVNPWGGVEAMLTHTISMIFNVPSAHAPMMTSQEVANLDLGVVDPRKSAETVSTTYFHCVLKGLHKSPAVISMPTAEPKHGLISAADISCLVIPDCCVGIPTLAALEQGIPVIAVKENKNRMRNNLKKYPFAPGKLIFAENYLEAAGIMSAIKAGVSLKSVRRPISNTFVYQNK